MAESEIIWHPEEAYTDCRMRQFLDHLGLADMAELHAWTEENPARFWDVLIRFLDIRFYKPYDQVLDLSRGIQWPDWCLGGRTNVVLNCLDKHRGTPIWDKLWLSWEGEDGEKRSFTYAEFDAEVCRFAAALEGRGYGPGDTIGLYMPMIPEAFVAQFAILKIGAIVVPLFSGFGPEPLRIRLDDCVAAAVVTADGTLRRGASVEMKSTLDTALEDCPSVREVFVVRRLGDRVPCVMTAGRDVWWHECIAGKPTEMRTQELEAETQGFLVYTSGTTGKPKGTVVTHCGAVTKIALDVGLCFDFQPSDTMLWVSDMGWVVGAMASISSTLHGGSLVALEGTPDYPDTTRHWRVMHEYGVSFLGIAPTTVRGMMRYGNEVDGFDFSALRIMVSTGEPWTRDAWIWLWQRVGGKRVPILNYTGGTECFGGIASGNLIESITPGSFNGPVPGTGARILREDGSPTSPGELGELVQTLPSIGNTRSLWKDDDLYMETYWSMFGDKWRQGDWAMIDEAGYWHVVGRSDDTLNIAGKRTGPAEVESALMATRLISEAAVIGVPDPVKGTALCCVCVPMPGVSTEGSLHRELSQAVATALGRAYRPRDIHFVSDLPKTRNMKIMRRVVRTVILGDPAGDLSALVNPEVVEELRQTVGGSGAAP